MLLINKNIEQGISNDEGWNCSALSIYNKKTEYLTSIRLRRIRY
jgi:hypothetical protein